VKKEKLDPTQIMIDHWIRAVWVATLWELAQWSAVVAVLCAMFGVGQP
jgi:hypothetical protein